jgi:hypothetical protein
MNLKLWILWKDDKTPWTDNMSYRRADTIKQDNTNKEAKKIDKRASNWIRAHHPAV